MCPCNKKIFWLAETSIHDSYLYFANIASLLCLYLSHCHKTQGLRGNRKHDWNRRVSRSAVYEDCVVTTVPSATSWFAGWGTAELPAAKEGVWVHRLTATAAYSPADSRNICMCKSPISSCEHTHSRSCIQTSLGKASRSSSCDTSRVKVEDTLPWEHQWSEYQYPR